MVRVFTERYFRTDYNYIFSLNVVFTVNFKRIQIFMRDLSAHFEELFVLKMLSS